MSVFVMIITAHMYTWIACRLYTCPGVQDMYTCANVVEYEQCILYTQRYSLIIHLITHTHTHTHTSSQASCTPLVVKTQLTATSPWRSTTQSPTRGRAFPTCTWLVPGLAPAPWTANSTSLEAKTEPYTIQRSNATFPSRISGGDVPT